MKTIKGMRHLTWLAGLMFMIVIICSVSVSAEGICYAAGNQSAVEDTAEEPAASQDATEDVPVQKTVLKYRVKSASGWTKYYSSGSTAAKVEKAGNITNLDVSVTSALAGMAQFKVYTAAGWSAYADSTDTSVTKGKIQAIKIRLTGELAEQYDIYYRVHITNGSWLGWTKNGGKAGSVDLQQRINAIKVKLVAKGGKAPGSTKNPYIVKPVLTYRSAFTNKGYSSYKAAGKTSGSKKNKTRITAISLKLTGSQLPGSIEYRVAGENTGYGDWVSAGKTAGKTKSTGYLSRMQIRLTGQLAKAYDVYYRVKIQNYGWLDWAKNGASAGSTGLGLNITAYQVKLVKKNADITFDTKNFYLIADQQEYVIKVNKKMNCITVYLNNKPIKAFICSTGEATPTGTFYTMVRYRWKQLIHEVWGQYCTRIVGHILFHSVPYSDCNNKSLLESSYRKLGTTASAGCIRLTCRDAKWIYDNCKLKTKVVIYNSSNPGPLGKPKAPYLPAGQKWDPTDPAFS